MTFAELPYEERQTITEKIQGIIGTKEQCTSESKSLSERIKSRKKYDDTFQKLAKIYIAYGETALSLTYVDKGWIKSGVTPNQKKWVLEMNNGYCERSRYCGTLFIDDKAVFTSGRIEKAFEYILNN